MNRCLLWFGGGAVLSCVVFINLYLRPEKPFSMDVERAAQNVKKDAILRKDTFFTASISSSNLLSIKPDVYGFVVPHASSALARYMIELDPSSSNEWKHLIDNPHPISWETYSNLIVLAEAVAVDGRPKIKAPQAARVRRSTSGGRPRSGKLYADDAEAEQVFRENLKKWEAAYPKVEVPVGAISVEQAGTLAMEACPVEFDHGQKPKVVLMHDFYLVTLWEPRRAKFAITFHVAHIRVHARTGEVLGIQLREDLKPKP